MKALLLSLLAVALIGCANFSTNLFRTEQTAVNLAYSAYTGYATALTNGTLKVSADDSNAVKVARIKFASSVSVLDSYRVAYETNSAAKPFAQAALESVLEQSSNLVWLINFVRTK